MLPPISSALPGRTLTSPTRSLHCVPWSLCSQLSFYMCDATTACALHFCIGVAVNLDLFCCLHCLRKVLYHLTFSFCSFGDRFLLLSPKGRTSQLDQRCLSTAAASLWVNVFPELISWLSGLTTATTFYLLPGAECALWESRVKYQNELHHLFYIGVDLWESLVVLYLFALFCCC